MSRWTWRLRLFEDIFDHHPAEAFILKATARCAENVKPANEVIKELLINAYMVNNDCTGLRVEIKLKWPHVSSTRELTRYTVNPKRGKEATDEGGDFSRIRGELRCMITGDRISITLT